MAKEMSYTVSAVAGLAAAGAVLVACGTGAGDTSGTPASSDAVGTSTMSGVGTVLVNSAGMTLYFNDQDHGVTVSCTSVCTRIWLPALTSSTTAPRGSAAGVTVLKRSDDGKEQLAYQGKPLYGFKPDAMAGRVTGSGMHDQFGGTSFTWHAAVVAGTGARATSGSGGGAGSNPGY
jgi:predicted lipoprotein with Yx(FWY)xxD motif